MNSRDYHAHISQVHRTPTILTDVPQYPNAHRAFNQKTYYEEEDEEAYRRYPHRHHHTPDDRERVEVVEYERATESDGYGNRSEVVYEEEEVDVERDESYPRRNRGGKGGFGLCKWKTFRP